MQKLKFYNITPAKGQALLNYQGRLLPSQKIEMQLFETDVIEEIRQKKTKQLKLGEKQKELNADFRNLLLHGDCLSACAYLKSQNIKVDLVYIDPPFASGANYAKKVYLRNGNKTEFENDNNSIGEEIMYGDIWQKEDYLNWLYERLLAIREIMSEEASIYVHLDWHIGHYAKIMLDEVFGQENFRNEIWTRRINKNLQKQFDKVDSLNNYGDYIFLYSKHPEIKYRLPKRDFFRKGYWHGFKQPADRATLRYELLGIKIDNGQWMWEKERAYKAVENYKKWKKDFSKDISFEDYVLNNKDLEFIRLGSNKMPEYYLCPQNETFCDSLWDDIIAYNYNGEYATEKNESLLERIITMGSDKGMIVADFFSGSGTTAKVANDLDRKFIVCDIGINAIQTTRDRLVKEGAEFDILKIKDGVRLFRNPAQTTQKIFSLVDGFKPRAELELGEFWDGGLVSNKGSFEPVKFIGIDKKLTKELLDVVLEEIYQLEETESGTNRVKIIYAYKDLDIDQNYLNKEIKKSGKTTIEVELVSLDDLLAEKGDMIFTEDNANVEIKKQGKEVIVKIKKYFSPYLKVKIDEYNAKRVKKGTLEEDEKKAIKISDNGLELIEAVQFDIELKKNGIWTSNLELEDKAEIKDKIKGVYELPVDKFKMKIRSIAGDEIVLDYSK